MGHLLCPNAPNGVDAFDSVGSHQVINRSKVGVLYIVTPRTDEIADWLADVGVSLPEDSSSRWPLLSEIHDVIGSLEGYSAEYSDNGVGSSWQAMITSANDPESGAWTLLNISHRGELSEPQKIWFEKGFPDLIVEILVRLSSRCGTLVLVPDTGCPPLVINAGDDPDQLCAQWEHLIQSDG